MAPPPGARASSPRFGCKEQIKTRQRDRCEPFLQPQLCRAAPGRGLAAAPGVAMTDRVPGPEILLHAEARAVEALALI